MATSGRSATEDARGADFSTSGAQFVEYEAFIEAQLRKTRSQVRGVDIATATMLLVVASVIYFFLAVVLDHWIVTGGLGFWSRVALLSIYVAGATGWTATQIVPLLVRKINPLYAAQTIERSRPTLKNALVNFLLFRSSPATVHERVLEQIEQQAATSLVGVEVEGAVDRSRVIRIGYVLVALVALGALYAVISPKNPFKTVGRVLMPWAEIAPPTSTTIDEIEPGNAQAFRGQQVTVKARVQGLADGQPVALYYSTADRQVVDRAVPMARAANDYRYAAVLPSGDAALQQSLTYRIEAGDARSRDYTIEVAAAPTIVVKSVEYRYPAYTGLVTQRVEHQGDLKAIEGTEVAIEGLANQPIAKAYVDFDANGSLDLPMRAEETTARASFRLGLNEDRTRPEHEVYQLTFKNPDGQQNPQPVRHRIEVVPDLPPEIQFLEPTQAEIEVPLDGAAELELVASDPDFALAEVRLTFVLGERQLHDEQLLTEPWRGQFTHRQRFVPARHKLAAGDVVEYYAVAGDNKTPRPNRTETARRRIRITSATGTNHADPGADNQAQAPQPAGKPPEAKSKGAGKQTTEAESGEGESEAGQKGEQRSPEDVASRAERESQSAGEKSSSGEKSHAPSPGSEARNSEQAEGPSNDKDQGNEPGQQEAGDQPGGEQSQGQSSSSESAASSTSDSSPADGSSRGNSQQRGGIASQSQGEQQPGGEQGEGSETGQGQQQSGSNQPGAQSAANGNQQGTSQTERQANPADRQSGAQASGGDGAQEPEPVASDGTNDGDAIERILKHRDDQKSEAGNQAGGEQAAGKQAPSQRGSGNDADQKSVAGDSQTAEQGSHREKQPGQSGSQQNADGKRNDGERADDSSQAPGQEGDEADEAGEDSADQNQAGSGSSQPHGGAKSQSPDQQNGQQRGQQPDSSAGAADSQPSNSKQSASQGQGEQNRASSPGDRGQNPGQAADEQSNDNKAQQPSADGESGREPSGKQDANGSQDGKPQPGEQGREPRDQSGATRDNNTRPDGTPQDPNTQGQGAQSQDDPTRSPNQQSEQSGEQRPDARGGDGEQAKGESGAGKPSQDDAGSPAPQESNQPREKSQQSGSNGSQEKREGKEQSPSTSKRESDSAGDENGDRSGGGEQGGGQKANEAGTGGAGQNTAADEGAGQSDESGDGETGQQAGDDQPTQKSTGQQGQQPGQGKQTQSGQGQKQSGGEQPQGQQGDEPGVAGQPKGDGAPGDQQPGATRPSGAGDARERQWEPGVDKADDANLDYTRKATDLAIEHLKDQLAEGDDSRLLDELGWTREEADAFLNRWEAMRSQAQALGTKGEAGRRELDQTLRSLGLRPRGSTIRSGGRPDDRAAGLQESRRTTPPAEYSEAFKAYTQGTARGGK